MLCQLAPLDFGFSLCCFNLSVWTLVSPCVVSTCTVGLWFRFVLCQLAWFGFGFIFVHGQVTLLCQGVWCCGAGAGAALVQGQVARWCRGIWPLGWLCDPWAAWHTVHFDLQVQAELKPQVPVDLGLVVPFNTNCRWTSINPRCRSISGLRGSVQLPGAGGVNF